MSRARITILGTAQDAGLPQLGCLCAACERARREPGYRRLPASVALTASSGRTLLVDATWALTEQSGLLARRAERPLGFDAVLLTHAHMGHVLGLPLLGREAASTRAMPVYATASMARFLAENRPFAHLVERGEIVPTPMEAGIPIAFDDLTVTPHASPHRGEDTDTVGLEVRGPRHTIVYLPDADRFDDAWVERIGRADAAWVDGTFHDPSELPGRDLTQIPHPFTRDSVKRLAGARGDVRFTHLNHGSRLLHPQAIEREDVLPPPFRLATDGETWAL
ncbi:MAG: MBL fold metallo-hydrolase [Planctomycetota bacterium]